MSPTLSFTFRVEILLLTLLIWLVVYFFINRQDVEQHRRLDFATKIDQKIPFVPQFSLVYFSTYPFILLPFIILTDARQFYWALASFITISVGSSLIHATVPSKIERVEQITAGGVSGRALQLFQKTCKPYGNFPSMHVGLSVPAVGAAYFVAGPVVGSIIFAWAVLIALSTLYTKQHYILDVLVGFAGGLLVVWLMSRLLMG